jgi:hypothetical protein
MLHYPGLSYRIAQTSVSSMYVIYFFLIGQNMFWFIYGITSPSYEGTTQL